MKINQLYKFKPLILIVLLLSLTTHSIADSKLHSKLDSPRAKKKIHPMLKKGLGVEVSMAFVGDDFASPIEELKTDYGLLWGLSLYNKLYFYRSKKWGMGLLITGFEISTSKDQYDNRAVLMSVLGLGINYTYALNYQNAIDFYYKLAPKSLLKISHAQDQPLGTLGLMHSIGLNYRYKIFNAGLSLNLGKLKNIDEHSKYYYQASNFEVKMGVLF